MFIIINIKYLLFLGEAERYINHISLFLIIYFLNNYENNTLAFVLILYGFLYWILELIVLRKNYYDFSEKYKSFNSVIKYLKSFNNKTIAIYPYNYLGGVFKIMLQTNNKVIFNALTNDKEEKYFRKHFNENYPFFSLKNFNKMTKELGVNFLIINNHDLKKNSKNWKPNNNWKVFFKDDYISCYELR